MTQKLNGWDIKLGEFMQTQSTIARNPLTPSDRSSGAAGRKKFKLLTKVGGRFDITDQVALLL